LGLSSARPKRAGAPRGHSLPKRLSSITFSLETDAPIVRNGLTVSARYHNVDRCQISECHNTRPKGGANPAFSHETGSVGGGGENDVGDVLS
jgi:hypothetical protein